METVPFQYVYAQILFFPTKHAYGLNTIESLEQSNLKLQIPLSEFQQVDLKVTDYIYFILNYKYKVIATDEFKSLCMYLTHQPLPGHKTH